MTPTGQQPIESSLAMRGAADALRAVLLENCVEVYSVDVSDIEFDPYVQMKCQNCINYGSSYRCPPYTPRYHQARHIVERFSNHYLVLMREDRFQWIETQRARHPDYSYKRLVNLASRNWDVTSYWKHHRLMLSIRRFLQQASDGGFVVLGPGGGCRLCRVCAVHQGEPCRRPTEAMASPESWGIDVYGTLIENGIEIEIPPRRVFTRVGFVASNVVVPEARIADGSRSDCTAIGKYSRDAKSVDRLLEELNKIPFAEVVEVQSLNGCEIDLTRCSQCDRNTTWLCDRSFLPSSELEDFLHKRICVVVQLSGRQSFGKRISYLVDICHRCGFYDALAFCSTVCDICDQCSEHGCMLTRKRTMKWGNKLAYRCLGYLGWVSGLEQAPRRQSPLVFLVMSSYVTQPQSR